METFDALRLCAAYAQETGMEAHPQGREGRPL